MLYLLHAWIRESIHGTLPGRLLQVLDQIQFRALSAAVLSFAIVLWLGPWVIRKLRAMKIGDTGQSDAEALRAHTASKANTPTMGGVLIAGAILASVLLLGDLTQRYVQLGVIVIVWTAVLGGVDDWLKLTSARRGGGRQGLYAWEKLVFQLGLGLLVGMFAYRYGDTAAQQDLAHVLNLPFQKTYVEGPWRYNPSLVFLPAWAYIVWTVLFMAGMSNAVNLTDGMDGLATGITSSVAFGLVVLAIIGGWEAASKYLYLPYVPTSDELAVVSGAMLGACLGFLWWNCSPAQVFMGDTGSLCLGTLIAYIALVIRQEALVIVMCAVFIGEIASVVLQVGVFKATKRRGGRRVFKCAPYHHHLHLCGWTEQQIVVRFWVVSVLLVVLALATIKLR